MTTAINPSPVPWQIPPPGTAEADRLRDQFMAKLLHILGPAVFLFMPEAGETTTTTDRTRHGVTITYSKDVTTFDTPPPLRLGSGRYIDFDGTDEEADLADNDRYSFGDGVNDSPFSIIALINPDDTTPAAQNTIFGKWNLDTDGELREYVCYLSATNGYPTMELYDESANAFIGRQDQTALGSGFHLVSFTYDAGGANSDISVGVDAIDLDDADVTSGSYTAMENSNISPAIAHRMSALATPVAETFFAGGIALIAVTAKELDEHEMWAIKELINSFYDLSL